MLGLLVPPNPEIARKPPQFPRDLFSERPAHLWASPDLEAPSLLPARRFRRFQDRFVFLELRLQRFGFRVHRVELRDPVLQLLMLAVHDELRFRTVPSQIFEVPHLLL